MNSTTGYAMGFLMAELVRKYKGHKTLTKNPGELHRGFSFNVLS